MTQTELLLERCRVSARVRSVAASAIVTGVRIRCRQAVQSAVADLLAALLTPSEAVKRFVEQAAVPRQGMTGRRLETYRSYLVTKGAIDEGRGAVRHLEGRQIEELLTTLEDGWRQSSKAENMGAEMERIGTCLEASGPAYRRFVRRADRLYRKQRSRLRAGIHDPHDYDAALAELGALYVSVFRDLLAQDKREK